MGEKYEVCITYTNLKPGDMTQTREVENGFYSLVLFEGTTMKNMLAINKEVAEKVLAGAEVQLLFNEQNVIVDVVS